MTGDLERHARQMRLSSAPRRRRYLEAKSYPTAQTRRLALAKFEESIAVDQTYLNRDRQQLIVELERTINEASGTAGIF